MDFSIIKQADLKQHEVAIIFGVSRLMAHRYLTGKSKPGRHTEQRISHALRIIAKLVEQGKLPLATAPFRSVDYDKERRMRAVEKIANHVKQTLAYE